MPTATTYPVISAKLGYDTETTKPQTVRAAVMPREDFLGLVTKAVIDAASYRQLTSKRAAQLLETAETMRSFPIATWIHPERGCGCVVGETLISQGYASRSEGLDGPVRDAITGFAPGEEKAIVEVGITIDNLVRDKLTEHGISTGMFQPVQAVVISDD